MSVIEHGGICILLHLLVLPVVNSKPARHGSPPIDPASLVRFSPEHRPTCVYNNDTYPAGHKFRPTLCTYCRCPRRGGRPICAIQDCYAEPSCVKYHKPPDECCGVCVEFGCLHSDGRSYPPGAVISTSSCETCRCPPGGGRTVCSKVACPPIDCVDAVHDVGDCCARCPNGANCWHGDQLLPAGVTVKDPGCRSCRCPPHVGHLPWNSFTKSVCSGHC